MRRVIVHTAMEPIQVCELGKFTHSYKTYAGVLASHYTHSYRTYAMRRVTILKIMIPLQVYEAGQYTLSYEAGNCTHNYIAYTDL